MYWLNSPRSPAIYAIYASRAFCAVAVPIPHCTGHSVVNEGTFPTCHLNPGAAQQLTIVCMHNAYSVQRRTHMQLKFEGGGFHVFHNHISPTLNFGATTINDYWGNVSVCDGL
jgi:hypothetical protein